ncbi:MAG: dienelactone hydrolase family protein [Akkermansiaceae bacterium]
MKLLCSLFIITLSLFCTAKPLPESPDETTKEYTHLIKGKWVHQEKATTENSLPFWFYADKKRIKSNKKYPLLIALHGRRNNAPAGQKFKVQTLATVFTKDDAYRRNPCFVVQPYYPPKGGWEKVTEELDETIKDLAKNFPIDTNRIYLVGFSNGAQGTFRSLARQPDWFAGGVTISGPVSPKEVAGKFKVPVWCWVGENDTPLNKNKRLPILAKELIKHDDRVKLTIVPKGKHTYMPLPLGDKKVHEWLFDQKLSK